jgi:hypothetical protein
VGLAYSLLNQGIAYVFQASYIFALRRSFARQSRLLREKPALCAGVGLGVCFGGALLFYLSFIVAAVNNSLIILAVLALPAYIALVAGGAVTLATLASVAFTWDLEEHPYRCLFAGQALAVVAGGVPVGGPILVALYVAPGVGAILVSEFSREEESEYPRIGWPTVFSTLVLAAALSFALYRAKDRLNGTDSPLHDGMARPIPGRPLPPELQDVSPPDEPEAKPAPTPAEKKKK